MKLLDPHLRHLVRKPRNYSAHEPMHPVQIDGYRRMTPTEKLERLAAFQRAGREMLKCGISAQHPEWTDAEIEREIRERMLYGVS